MFSVAVQFLEQPKHPLQELLSTISSIPMLININNKTKFQIIFHKQYPNICQKIK